MLDVNLNVKSQYLRQNNFFWPSFVQKMLPKPMIYLDVLHQAVHFITWINTIPFDIHSIQSTFMWMYLVLLHSSSSSSSSIRPSFYHFTIAHSYQHIFRKCCKCIILWNGRWVYGWKMFMYVCANVFISV